MSRRYGRYLAAFGGLAALAFAEPLKAANEQRAQPQQQVASQPTTLLNQLKQPASASQCPSGDQQQQPSRLLQEVGIWSTFAQAVVGLIGLIGLIFTVLYARAAWKAAHDTLEDSRRDAADQAERFTAQLKVATDAASAAMRHAEIADDTARKQLRPYLYAESMHLFWDRDEHPIFTAVLRNSGQTPAIDVTIGSSAAMGNIQLFPQPAADLRMGRVAFIGANTASEQVILTEGASDINSVDISTENLLHLVGRIRYSDIFGDQFETEFGFYTHVSKPSANGMSQIAGHRPVFRKR